MLLQIYFKKIFLIECIDCAENKKIYSKNKKRKNWSFKIILIKLKVSTKKLNSY